MAPELIVFCGPMFSGKTTAMLSTLDRYKYQQRHIYTFKPKVDDRYATTDIVSHMGWKVPATTIETGADLIRELMLQVPDSEISESSVVAVDELFMIPGVAKELIWLYKNDITVVVSTLDLSSNGTPFDELSQLMPWATKIKKCAAVCSVCKGDARYTWRKPGVDEEIVIGGGELYEPRCKLHHPKMMK